MLSNLIVITTSLLAIFAFSLGVFSLWRNPKAKVVHLWFLTSMAVTVWGLGLLLVILSKTEVAGIFYSRLLHISASFVPVFFCHFVLAFLFYLYGNNIKTKFFVFIGYFLAFIFAILSFSDLIVPSASSKLGFATWADDGQFYFFYLLYFIVYIIASICFLYMGYKKSDGVIKRKTFYILIASFIGFGGACTNFLPQTLGIYPFGQFFVWLYPILVTYGIFFDEIKIKIRT